MRSWEEKKRVGRSGLKKPREKRRKSAERFEQRDLELKIGGSNKKGPESFPKRKNPKRQGKEKVRVKRGPIIRRGFKV